MEASSSSAAALGVAASELDRGARVAARARLVGGADHGVADGQADDDHRRHRGRQQGEAAAPADPAGRVVQGVGVAGRRRGRLTARPCARPAVRGQQGRRVVLGRPCPRGEAEPAGPRPVRRRARLAASPPAAPASSRLPLRRPPLPAGVRTVAASASSAASRKIGRASSSVNRPLGPGARVGRLRARRRRTLRRRFVGAARGSRVVRRSVVGHGRERAPRGWCSWSVRAHRVATSSSVLSPGVGSASGEDHQTLPLVRRVPPRSGRGRGKR